MKIKPAKLKTIKKLKNIIMSKLIPSRGYCLIQPLEAEEVSAGGVYLPDRVKDAPQKGKVLAIGEDKNIHHDFPTPVHECFIAKAPCKVGDTVIFKRFVDNRIKEEGKELLLVKFEDILAVYA